MPVEKPSFTDDRIERLIEMEREHFWFAGRRILVDALLRRHAPGRGAELVDVGVGGGYYAELLSERGYRVTAVDFLAGGLRRLGTVAPAVRRLRSTAEQLAMRDGAFDCALALDVLEHTDDEPAAAELYRILRPGGVAVVTVPAFSWLWSYRDEAAGHKRRYTRRGLEELLRGAGFAVRQAGYYGCLLLPLTALSRFAGRVTPATRDMEDVPPWAVNQIFRAINCGEARVGTRLAWPVGSTVFACVEKR
jgi:SAM-dependent methyltransferase